MMNLVTRLLTFQHRPFAPTWSNYARFESVLSAAAFLLVIEAALYYFSAYLYPVYKMVTHAAATSDVTKEIKFVEDLHKRIKADVAKLGFETNRLLHGTYYVLLFVLIWFNDARLLQGVLLTFGFALVADILLHFSRKLRLDMLAEGLTLFAVGFTVALIEFAVSKTKRLFKRQAPASAKG